MKQVSQASNEKRKKKLKTKYGVAARVDNPFVHLSVDFFQ